LFGLASWDYRKGKILVSHDTELFSAVSGPTGIEGGRGMAHLSRDNIVLDGTFLLFTAMGADTNFICDLCY
jgi:hypothetical protein